MDSALWLEAGSRKPMLMQIGERLGWLVLHSLPVCSVTFLSPAESFPNIRCAKRHPVVGIVGSVA